VNGLVRGGGQNRRVNQKNRGTVAKCAQGEPEWGGVCARVGQSRGKVVPANEREGIPNKVGPGEVEVGKLRESLPCRTYDTQEMQYKGVRTN